MYVRILPPTRWCRQGTGALILFYCTGVPELTPLKTGSKLSSSSELHHRVYRLMFMVVFCAIEIFRQHLMICLLFWDLKPRASSLNMPSALQSWSTHVVWIQNLAHVSSMCRTKLTFFCGSMSQTTVRTKWGLQGTVGLPPPLSLA